MALLNWVPLAACSATACYAPELPDCAVACATAADCAPGQVCGGDSMCASPPIAGQCAQLATPDAVAPGDGGGDAPPRDAAVPGSDAPLGADAAILDAPITPMVQLRIEIRGGGQVEVAGYGTCHAPLEPCTYAVPQGVAAMLAASAYPGWQFEKWQGPCDGQDEACTITPATSATKVTARFEENDDDDDDSD